MKRIIAGLVLVVIFAVPAIFGPAWALLAIALLVTPICMFELLRAALSRNATVLSLIAIASSLPFLFFAYKSDLGGCFLTVGVTSVILMITSLFLFEKEKSTAKDLVYSITALIYPMSLIGFWILLRMGIDGRFWMIFGIVGVFGSDVGAYYVGKNLGKNRIAPRLSPKKTVEGFIGGVCTSIALGYAAFVIYNKVTDYYQLSPMEGFYPVWLLILLSTCIGVLDLAGDLTASMFKREFQIKDLGNIIPGHGGMLDRMDGIMPVACLLYCILKAVS